MAIISPPFGPPLGITVEFWKVSLSSITLRRSRDRLPLHV